MLLTSSQKHPLLRKLAVLYVNKNADLFFLFSIQTKTVVGCCRTTFSLEIWENFILKNKYFYYKRNLISYTALYVWKFCKFLLAIPVEWVNRLVYSMLLLDLLLLLVYLIYIGILWPYLLYVIWSRALFTFSSFFFLTYIQQIFVFFINKIKWVQRWTKFSVSLGIFYWNFLTKQTFN